MTNPFKVQVAQDINKAHWHALFFDQALGPAVGGVVNDISAELAANNITAEDAAEQVKEAVDDSSSCAPAGRGFGRGLMAKCNQLRWAA